MKPRVPVRLRGRRCATVLCESARRIWSSLMANNSYSWGVRMVGAETGREDDRKDDGGGGGGGGGGGDGGGA